MVSEVVRYFTTNFAELVLILIVLEDGLGVDNGFIVDIMEVVVLILIVLEDGLGVSAQYQKKRYIKS